jgi:hypothetical protein
VIRGLLVLAGILIAGAAAAQPACKGSPQIRECRSYEDAVVFIRSVDGILAFAHEYSAEARWWPIAGPGALPSQLFYDLRRNPTIVLHGDYETCFGPAPNATQETACIERASNVVARIPQYD